jgi:hypothetical protein
MEHLIVMHETASQICVWLVGLLAYIQGVTTIYETSEIFLMVGHGMLKYSTVTTSQRVSLTPDSKGPIHEGNRSNIQKLHLVNAAFTTVI